MNRMNQAPKMMTRAGMLAVLMAMSTLAGCMLDSEDPAADDGLGTVEQHEFTGTYFGTYKIRIQVTNADMWKTIWWCDGDNGSETKIDGDTFPASTTTTRETHIDKDKCPSGRWRVSFQIKKNSNWRDVHPGAAVCGNATWCGYHDSPNIDLLEDEEDLFQKYARADQDWTNSSDKLCLVGINNGWDKVYVYKRPCG